MATSINKLICSLSITLMLPLIVGCGDRITRQVYVPIASETEEKVDPNLFPLVTLGATNQLAEFQGQLESTKPIEKWELQLPEGFMAVIQLKATGSEFDSLMVLTDPNGIEHEIDGKDDSGKMIYHVIPVTEAGTYELTITEYLLNEDPTAWVDVTDATRLPYKGQVILFEPSHSPEVSINPLETQFKPVLSKISLDEQTETISSSEYHAANQENFFIGGDSVTGGTLGTTKLTKDNPTFQFDLQVKEGVTYVIDVEPIALIPPGGTLEDQYAIDSNIEILSENGLLLTREDDFNHLLPTAWDNGLQGQMIPRTTTSDENDVIDLVKLSDSPYELPNFGTRLKFTAYQDEVLKIVVQELSPQFESGIEEYPFHLRIFKFETK